MEQLNNYIAEKLAERIAPDPEQSKKKAGSGTTDDALYYRMGRFKFYWAANKSRMEGIANKYNIRGANKRAGLIAWQKDVAYPLCPEELEAIPRKDWELDILDGVSEDALYHKHYDIWWDYIYKHHKPRHQVLTVFECSNQKPYCYVGSIRYYPTRWSDWTDFASMDYGIQQWEFVNMYPSRWDEWDHYKEDARIQYLYAEKTKERILEYHKNFPQYKKIIFICQNNHPQRPVNELWADNTDNFRDWAIVLTDDDFRKGIRAAYPDMEEGILIQRTLNTDYTHKKYAEALASCYSNPKDKEAIKERVKWDINDCKKAGLYNIYSPEIAKLAYKRGVSPFDEKFMKEYKEQHNSEDNKDDENEDD